MSKRIFHVTAHAYADTGGSDIEADSADAAMEIYVEMDEASPSVCHQCSEGVQFGDFFMHTVQEGGKEVYNDLPSAGERREIVALLGAIEASVSVNGTLEPADIALRLRGILHGA